MTQQGKHDNGKLSLLRFYFPIFFVQKTHLCRSSIVSSDLGCSQVWHILDVSPTDKFSECVGCFVLSVQANKLV